MENVRIAMVSGGGASSLSSLTGIAQELQAAEGGKALSWCAFWRCLLERKSPIPPFKKGVVSKTSLCNGGGAQHQRVIIKNHPLHHPALDYSGCSKTLSFRTPYGLTPYRKSAFTLAEVLITIGIIGVVAAMTLPALIQKNRETELTTRAKRMYSEISQAIKLYEAQNGTPGELRGLFEAKNGVSNSGQLAEDFAKYFNGAKVCKKKTDRGCSEYFYTLEYAIPYVDSEGNLTARSFSNPKIILNDGIVIGVNQASGCGIKVTEEKHDANGRPVTDADGNPVMSTWYTACTWLYIDTNGPKKPNKYGMDAFELEVHPEKLTVGGAALTGRDSLNSLLTNGKLKYTNYKVGEKMEF